MLKNLFKKYRDNGLLVNKIFEINWTFDIKSLLFTSHEGINSRLFNNSVMNYSTKMEILAFGKLSRSIYYLFNLL